MIVAFTGHRPEGLGDDSAGAWIAIKEFLMESRPDGVISGMADGIDTFVFDIAVDLGIPVTAAVPWIGHGSKRYSTPEQQGQYLRRLDKAARVVITSEVTEYDVEVFFIRNRWMVDNSDLLVGVWNGLKAGGTWHALEYARKVGRDVRLLKWRAK